MINLYQLIITLDRHIAVFVEIPARTLMIKDNQGLLLMRGKEITNRMKSSLITRKVDVEEERAALAMLSSKTSKRFVKD